MGFTLIDKKGLSKFLIDKNIDSEKIHMHISEIEPGMSSHNTHEHPGLEVIYVFNGNGTLKIETQKYPIGPNEAIVIDSSKTHGLTNSGVSSLRYMVIKLI